MSTYQHLHTALWVSDLARAEHFYGTVLGIPKAERFPFNFPGAWYQVGSSQIHLIVTEEPLDQGQQASRGSKAKWGRHPHVALGVEDLEAVKARLLQAGYEVQPSASGRAAVFVRDPDGNVIELSSISPPSAMTAMTEPCLPQQRSVLNSLDPATALVSSAQMRRLEEEIFAAGMPVAALMEKVGLAVFARLRQDFPQAQRIGILCGTGHNAGDGLVVGRELRLAQKGVKVWLGKPDLKPLTADHARYLRALGAEFVERVEALADCDLLIDALFGIGLNRPLGDPWAGAVEWANGSSIPILSLDLPSGLNDQTGEIWGCCIRASHTYALGLWKRGLWQEAALPWVGRLHRLDFGIPPWVCPAEAAPQLLLNPWPHFPPDPPLDTHKYRQGSLLVVAGSAAYAGAAVLAGLGSRASGVGMVTLVVPAELKGLIHSTLPEALVHPWEGIPALPPLGEKPFQAVAVGPGLGEARRRLLESLLQDWAGIPWVIDADGLNALAEMGVERLQENGIQAILTPHLGEFRRLFPGIPLADRMEAAQKAAAQSGAVVVLKGARTVIASPTGECWVNPESTPALARGGSGDVLTGLIGGLMARRRAQLGQSMGIAELLSCACAGVWWHAQAAIQLAGERGLTGVDPAHLGEYLPKALSRLKVARTPGPAPGK